MGSPKKDPKLSQEGPGKSKERKSKKESHNKKKFSKACKEAGRSHYICTSHNAHKYCGQGRKLQDGNPAINRDSKKQMQKMIAATVRK